MLTKATASGWPDGEIREGSGDAAACGDAARGEGTVVPANSARVGKAERSAIFR
ncbi:MAG: hypothetical protein LBQ62_10085 [Candidatus Accumulibacter sp.]|nr:hypothetical protein [Accumulibacter sp.]